MHGEKTRNGIFFAFFCIFQEDLGFKRVCLVIGSWSVVYCRFSVDCLSE